MIFREPETWRWRHARHHSDTIIVGRDAEIEAFKFYLGHFLPKTVEHSAGRLWRDEPVLDSEAAGGRRRVVVQHAVGAAPAGEQAGFFVVEEFKVRRFERIGARSVA